uniref:50S ribosomal protein L9, chloroplastic n=1 Tax=Chondria sp. (in: red algae) TaxID=1982705 RepID=A0A1Z1MCS1_9FLOR|nr:ribosomal protein L9 [Chondria sp. (in: red algae)]
MGKKVKVIIKTSKFREEKKGTILNVSPGYAFNYLIPQNLAEIATTKKIKHFGMFSEREEQKQKANFIANEKIKNTVGQIRKISIYKKKGDNHLIFGSIKEKEISDWIAKYTNVKLVNKQIKLTNINQTGMSLVTIQVKPSIEIRIKLYSLPSNI